MVPGLDEAVAGEEVDEIAGCASFMGVCRIVEVDSRARRAGCSGVWGRFYSGLSGKERSQGWDEGDREQG